MEEDPTWKGLLKTYHSKLRTGLLLDNVLPALRPLLTDAEYLCVESKEGDIGRVDELVRILLTKEYSIFEGFCSALEKNGYPRWAKKLRGNGGSFQWGRTLAVSVSLENVLYRVCLFSACADSVT